jgi:hypothetical protein
VLTGCSKKAGTPPVTASPTPAAPSAETRAAFSSPEALTKFLEQRWPLTGIQTFCIPERRHNQQFENLGVEGQVWRGSLFANKDRVRRNQLVHENTKNSRATIYSLGARREDLVAGNR